MNTSSYSYVAQAYSDDVEAVIGLMETICGLGCLAGPVLGSFVYGVIGYSWTFYAFGIAMAPSFLFALCLRTPKSLKEEQERKASEGERSKDT